MSDSDENRSSGSCSAGGSQIANSDGNRSAGDSPAVPGATRPRFGSVQIRERGRLPHWESDGATYFVTFRLQDTVPESLRRQVEERKKLPIKLPRDQRPSVKEMEAYLDRCTGACHLKNSNIAESGREHDPEVRGYSLSTACLGNHAQPCPSRYQATAGPVACEDGALAESYTSKEANRILQRSGTFWQREYYDRLIRDDAELNRAVQYVRANPEKAGLPDWKWVG